MTLLLCIFCFVFASIYSSSTGKYNMHVFILYISIPHFYVIYSCAAQEVQVCVSYGGPELGELFINVNWNVSCM